MIKAIARFIRALNGNIKKSQLAAGFAWGLLLGLIPAGNVFWVALFLFSFFLKHNYWSKLLFMILLKIFSPLIAPLTDMLGWEILHISALQPLFTTMYNTPFVPFTKFNNTLVAGGITAGIALWVPVFLLFMGLIPLYRNTIGDKLRNSKLVRRIVKFPLFSALDLALKGK